MSVGWGGFGAICFFVGNCHTVAAFIAIVDADHVGLCGVVVNGVGPPSFLNRHGSVAAIVAQFAAVKARHEQLLRQRRLRRLVQGSSPRIDVVAAALVMESTFVPEVRVLGRDVFQVRSKIVRTKIGSQIVSAGSENKAVEWLALAHPAVQVILEATGSEGLTSGGLGKSTAGSRHARRLPQPQVFHMAAGIAVSITSNNHNRQVYRDRPTDRQTDIQTDKLTKR